MAMDDDYKKLLEIGENFFSVKDANHLLELILDHSKNICDAERSTLFIKEMDYKTEKDVLRSYMATEIGGKLKEITLSAKIGIVGYTFNTGQVQVVNDVTKNSFFNPKIDEQTHFKTRSILSIPLIQNFGKPFGVIQVLNKKHGDFEESDVRKVKLLSLLAVTALTRIHDQQQLKKIKERLSEAQLHNIEHLSFETVHEGLREIYNKVDVVANSNSSILLLGDSGTGKEVMARRIHNKSDRRENPFVVVNCAAIAPTLFEAELFGIVDGVATDVKARDGVFQKAHGGTLFLDEIGELPFEMQSKLLRVLQEKKVSKVGETEEKFVDIRLITATNRDLAEEIKQENKFREDLFFRINVFQFRLPSLSERMADIPLLCEDLLHVICRDQNAPDKKLSSQALEKLQGYSWPGNIRELKNVLERACVLAQADSVISDTVILLPEATDAKVIPLSVQSAVAPLEIIDMNLVTKRFQKDYALKVVDHFEGNKSKAAKSLNISREGLRKILNRDVA
jgi:transcriptional regulator with GAF, ATPase, and Fis domain